MKLMFESWRKFVNEDQENVQEEPDNRPKPYEVLEAFEEFQRYLTKERTENTEKFGDELLVLSGTRTREMKVLGMLQALAGDPDHVPYKEE